MVQDIVAIDADGESLGLRQLERLADIGIQPPYSGKEYHPRPLVALMPRQSGLEERYAPGVRGRIGENRSRRAFRNNLRQPVQRTTVLECTEARAVDRCNIVCTLRISERHIRTGEPIDGPAVVIGSVPLEIRNGIDPLARDDVRPRLRLIAPASRVQCLVSSPDGGLLLYRYRIRCGSSL